MRLLFFIFFCISNTFALELAGYMQKCSESDPNINQCLIEKGNLAIPTLVKGDSTYGVPVLSPVHHPELKLTTDNFKLVLTNIYFDDFKNFKITDVEYDVDDKKTFAVFQIPFLNFSADYALETSKILSHTLHGSGHFDMSLVNNIITYDADPSRVTKDGDLYLKFSNQEVSLTTERCYFFFENLEVDGGGVDVNAYMNEHWDVVWDAIKPGIGRFFAHYIHVPYQAISQTVPIKDLFLR